MDFILDIFMLSLLVGGLGSFWLLFQNRKLKSRIKQSKNVNTLERLESENELNKAKIRRMVDHQHKLENSIKKWKADYADLKRQFEAVKGRNRDLGDVRADLEEERKETGLLRKENTQLWKRVADVLTENSHLFKENAQFRQEKVKRIEDDKKRIEDDKKQVEEENARLREQMESISDQVSVSFSNGSVSYFFPEAYERDPDTSEDKLKPHSDNFYVVSRAYKKNACFVTGARPSDLGHKTRDFQYVCGAHISSNKARSGSQMHGTLPMQPSFDVNSPRNRLLLRKDIEIGLEKFWLTFDFDTNATSAEDLNVRLRVVHPDVDELIREHLEKRYAKLKMQDAEDYDKIIGCVHAKRWDNSPIDCGYHLMPFRRCLRAHILVSVSLMVNDGWRRDDCPTFHELHALRERMNSYAPSLPSTPRSTRSESV